MGTGNTRESLIGCQNELDRLDLQHHVITLLLNGELHMAPLHNPEDVLDIGTGTGIWAIEMADRYPHARIVGTDLSPVQPTWWVLLLYVQTRWMNLAYYPCFAGYRTMLASRLTTLKANGSIQRTTLITSTSASWPVPLRIGSA